MVAMVAMRIKPSASRASRFLVGVLLGTLSITAVRAQTPAAIDTVQSFFTWALVRHASPLPPPKERVAIANWMTPDLMTLLDTARVTQDRCIRRAPKGDKPNLLEGDLFVGNKEGATEAAYQLTKQVDGETVISVDMIYLDKRWPRGDRRRTVAWKADVALATIHGRWYVDDIRFAHDRSLRTTLQNYNDDGARECIAHQPG